MVDIVVYDKLNSISWMKSVKNPYSSELLKLRRYFVVVVH